MAPIPISAGKMKIVLAFALFLCFRGVLFKEFDDMFGGSSDFIMIKLKNGINVLLKVNWPSFNPSCCSNTISISVSSLVTRRLKSIQQRRLLLQGAPRMFLSYLLQQSPCTRVGKDHYPLTSTIVPKLLTLQWKSLNVSEMSLSVSQISSL